MIIHENYIICPSWGISISGTALMTRCRKQIQQYVVLFLTRLKYMYSKIHKMVFLSRVPLLPVTYVARTSKLSQVICFYTKHKLLFQYALGSSLSGVILHTVQNTFHTIIKYWILKLDIEADIQQYHAKLPVSDSVMYLLYWQCLPNALQILDSHFPVSSSWPTEIINAKDYNQSKSNLWFLRSYLLFPWSIE